MQTVDPGFLRLILDHAFPDIPVELRIGKAEVFLIGLAAQAVNRCLVDQHIRQSEHAPNGLHLRHRQVAAGAEVAGCIAVPSGIADPVLGEIAGIGHASVMALRHGIQRGHADTRRNVGAGLHGNLKGQMFHDTFDRILHIDFVMLNSQMINQKICHVNIMLVSAGHQHADHAVFPQRFHAQCSHNGAVLAAGNPDNGIASLAVFLKEIPDPLNHCIPGLFRIKHSDSAFPFFTVLQFFKVRLNIHECGKHSFTQSADFPGRLHNIRHHDRPEPSAGRRADAVEAVLNGKRFPGLHLQQPAGRQEDLRVRLALCHHIPADNPVKVIIQPCIPQFRRHRALPR